MITLNSLILPLITESVCHGGHRESEDCTE